MQALQSDAFACSLLPNGLPFGSEWPGVFLTEPSGGDWTGYAPLANSAGTFLFPERVTRAPFYVFVAPSDVGAKQFLAPFTRIERGRGALDVLQGNVVLSSDASLTEVRLNAGDPLPGEGSMAGAEPTRVIPTPVKLEVWKRDQGRCVECGAIDNLHFDHVFPWSRGGSSLTSANVQLLCARHNIAICS